MDYEKMAKNFCDEYEDITSSNFTEELFEYVDGIVPVYYHAQYEEYNKLEEPHIMRITVKELIEQGCSNVEQYIIHKIFEAYYGELYPLVESILEEREEE